ncbi:MAG: phosphoheptose isomerase [Burkholderiales bacterium]|nr:phosphoheptose isomerase [Burkholderiales bacterium]
MDLIERVNQHFYENMAVMEEVRELLTPHAAGAGERLVAALMADCKILACGNGGSAAEAQHFVSEMVGRFEKERPGLAALSLNTDAAVLTAVANDYDYDLIFSKQVRALGQPGDVLVVLTTSGNSVNVVEAVHAAHERQMTVIALTGRDGGKVGELLAGDDIHLNVPSHRTARIQEAHLLLLHTICDAIDFILLDGE